MSYSPSVSLIIVSRNRCAGLRRLISALRFQTYTEFEVVVVSNYPEEDIRRFAPPAENAKLVYFDEANISAARNRGVQHSAGEILAFIDDDAVPEPFWLERLIAPFIDAEVGSSGGYVRGRNGIDFQWTALKCDVFGDDHILEMPDEVTTQKSSWDGQFFARVQGTNCAFRKMAVIEAGGFDENFRYFLDETDLGIRLAKAGWATAVVPLAEVQHGFEASADRTANRAPKSLRKIGASKRYFLDKHSNNEGCSSLELLRTSQRKRLVNLMVSGHIEPSKVSELMCTFEQGVSATMSKKDTNERIRKATEHSELKPFIERVDNKEMEFLACAGNVIFARRMAVKALELLSENKCVTVIRFTYTALYHRRFFDPRGFWVQTGGVFGKSDRSDAAIRPRRFLQRVVEETKRIRWQRPIKRAYLFGIFGGLVIELPETEQHTQIVKSGFSQS